MKFKYVLFIASIFANAANAQTNENKIEIVKGSQALPSALPKMPAQGLPMQAFPEIYSPPKIYNEIPKNPQLSFQEVQVSELLKILFQEMNTNSYVLSPEIATDQRIISFKYDSKKDGSMILFIKTLLSNLDYEIELQNNVYFVKKKANNKSSQLYEIYRPKYRDTAYIINLLRPIFPNAFTATSSIPNPTGMNTSTASNSNATSMIDQKVDTLIYHADSKEELKRITDILVKIDIEEENLEIESLIYEVSYSNKDGSALGLVMNLASKKLNINLGSANPLTNYAQLSTNAVNLLISNIETDNRFRLVSRPLLRAKNGAKAVLNVGSKVPTLGTVSYQGNSSTPVQSVEYKDTGLTFQITPTIKESSIDIDLNQVISEVQATNTGVNNTPTLTNRSLQSSFSIRKDEVILLAGLTHNKNSNDKSRPFFLPFFSNNVSEKDNTEILIFLKVTTAKENKNDLLH